MDNKLNTQDITASKKTAAQPHEHKWQASVANSLGSLSDLLSFVELSQHDIARPLEDQLAQFPMRVPLAYAEKIEKGNPQDPLLLQVLPQAQEYLSRPGFVKDPLAETQANPVAGIIHKYKSRVLMVTTQACLIHCRYCFRRHFPYENNAISSNQLVNALYYIEQHLDIDEVILSGGDPMSLADTKLADLLYALVRLPHIKRLRIHSRLLAVMPERVTEQFLKVVKSLGKPLVVVLHINHAQEVDDTLIAACHKMKQVGVHLLSQSVLLRGVNDSANALIHLNLRVFDAGILPYYLHLLDPVAGAHHFDVPLETGRALMSEVQSRLSGYLVPKFVTERPGLQSKLLLDFATL